MKTLIRNARLVSPGLEIPDGWLLMENGGIVSTGSSAEVFPEAERSIDAEGRRVLPGFIDIHSHGADGCDVCDASPESIRHIARRKLAEGVTTWLPTTLTQPRELLEEVARAFAEYHKNQEFTRTPGLHLEGPFIHRDRAGAQNPQYVRPADIGEVEKLAGIAPVLLLSLAPELPGALELIHAARAMGIASSAAHTSATCAEVLAAKAAGLTHLTHFGNAMTPLHHREIGVVGAGLLDDDLMLEIIGDTVHLSGEMKKLVFKTVPVERIMIITDSMAASWRPDGRMNFGGLDVVVEGGIARLNDSGALAGSTCRYHEAVRDTAASCGLPAGEWVKTTGWNQARSLGLDGFGKIEPGFAADLVILDEDFSVWKTLVGGEVRYPF